MNKKELYDLAFGVDTPIREYIDNKDAQIKTKDDYIKQLEEIIEKMTTELDKQHKIINDVVTYCRNIKILHHHKSSWRMCAEHVLYEIERAKGVDSEKRKS